MEAGGRGVPLAQEAEEREQAKRGGVSGETAEASLERRKGPESHGQ